MKLLCLSLLLAALAPSSRAADLPAINDPSTADLFPGKFVWADLLTADQAAARTFYTGLFGWTATTIDRTTPERGPLSYIELSNNGRPVAGIAVGPSRLRSETRGHWLAFVSVADVPAALAAATENGGHVLSPTRALAKRGTQAIFTDSEGALLGLVHSSSGDPGEYRPEPGDFTWAEVFSRDPAAAGGFYQKVIGYTVTPDSRPGRSGTFILESGGYARASLAPLPDRPNARPAWLLFVRVGNIGDSLAKVTALGGRVLSGVREVHGTSRVAVIADPVGAALGLVEKEEPAPAAKGTP
jgi:predicted enzyme related to lactoylglutathione lyase